MKKIEIMVLGLSLLATLGTVQAGEIRSVLAPDKCVDIEQKSQIPGARVILWPCHGQVNQSFEYNSANGEISVFGGAICLSAGSGANGTGITTAACQGGTTTDAGQRWTLSDGTIRAANGTCLDISRKDSTSGVQLIAWSCNGGDNQAWTHDLQAAPTPVPFEFHSALAPDKCLDIEASSSTPGARVLLWPCHGQPNQSFTYSAANGEISALGGSVCLSAGSGIRGAGLTTAACQGGASTAPAQQWSWDGNVIRGINGLCIDIARKDTTNGVQLIVWSCNGGLNQSWTQGETPDPDPTPDPTPEPTPEPTPTPTSSPSGAIRVLQWNVEDGTQTGEIGTVVSKTPQIVFLEEIDSTDQIENIRAGLEDDQGVPFYREQIGREGTTSSGSWVAIVSKFKLSNVRVKKLRDDGEVVSCGGSSATVAARSVIGGQTVINGKQIALIAVRTNFSSLKCVTQEEVRDLKAWAEATYPGMTRIYGGDFNTGAGESPYDSMVGEAQQSVDSWYESVLDHTAKSWDDSPSFYTPTRSGRLDYLFYQTGPAILELKSAEIYPLTGYSDHRPIMSVFDVR